MRTIFSNKNFSTAQLLDCGFIFVYTVISIVGSVFQFNAFNPGAQACGFFVL